MKAVAGHSGVIALAAQFCWKFDSFPTLSEGSSSQYHCSLVLKLQEFLYSIAIIISKRLPLALQTINLTVYQLHSHAHLALATPLQMHF